MYEKLQEYMAQKNFRFFEGQRGVRQLETIMREVCGYGSYNTMDMFLEDNPGCQEAIVEWIGNQRVAEWENNMDQMDLFGEVE